MFYKKYLFLLLLLFAVNFYAQLNSIKNITINDGLPSNSILDIQQDKIGYLWVVTDKGLVKFDGDDFTQIHKQKSTSLLIKNNIVYTGLENGLSVIKNGTVQFYESKKVIQIVSFNNAVFVGTSQGVYKLEKEYLKPLQINTAIDFSIVNDIVEVEGFFYIATNKSFWKVDNLEKPKSVHKLIDDSFISLAIFQNNIIAATLNNGVKIISNNSVQKTITTQNSISSIKKIKNEVWITSNENGIEVYTLPSFTFKQKINKYNSQITNSINTVFKDHQNSIWIASNKGLFKISEKNILSSESKKPTIYFESLLVNHKNIDSLFTSKKPIIFSPSENNIAISFKTVDLTKPNNVLYRYKLDDEFSPWTTKNQIQFPNLKPGKFTLEVQSMTEDEFSNIKSFSFKIEAPIYKQTWFIIAAVTMLLFIGYLLLDFYLKKIHQKNKEKVDQLKLENHLLSLEQKALQLQMNPHFIFNVLNGIKALGNSGKIEELNTSISQFSVLLRSILTNSRLEEISLYDEMLTLGTYLQLEQQMSSKSFAFNIETKLNNIDTEEILIPSMLIQPFVENAIKHGFEANKEGRINITFIVKNNFLECSIIDNGIGIHQSNKRKEKSNHNSVALKVSKERIKNISPKNSFYIDEIIEDSITKGTKVWFKIPLKTDY